MARRLLGLVAAAALWLGATGDARAQLSISVGNPYTGSGLYIGNSYGYPGYGYGGLGYASPYGMYSSGYYGAPVTSYYSSGYYGGYGYPGVYRYRYGRGFGVPFLYGRRWGRW